MRKMVRLGTIGAAVIILLAVFPNIVNAHATSLSKEINNDALKLKISKTIEDKIFLFKSLFRIGIDRFDGILIEILSLLFAIFVYLFGWMFP